MELIDKTKELLLKIKNMLWKEDVAKTQSDLVDILKNNSEENNTTSTTNTEKQEKIEKTQYKDGVLYIKEKTLPFHGDHEDETAPEIINIQSAIQEAIQSDPSNIELIIDIDSLHFDTHEAKIIDKRVEKILQSGKHINISFVVAKSSFDSENDIDSIDTMWNRFLHTHKKVNPNEEDLAKVQLKVINRDSPTQTRNIEHRYQTTP